MMEWMNDKMNVMRELKKPGLFLLGFLFCMHSNKTTAQSSVTLYAFPPTYPYRWQHPHSLLTSVIRNYYFGEKHRPKRVIGHMVIELRKDSSSIFTAMATDDFTGFRRSVLKDKIGLAVLFKLEPGHLEKTADLKTELKYRIEESGAAFISFKISDSAYQYLRMYIDSFKIKGYDKLYNGLNMPRSGEGSGCTAFAISFLELINVLSPEYKDQWAVKLNVPEKLIGDTASKKRVSLWRIFFSFRWARKNKPSRPLTLYEPWLVYRWLNEVWDNEEKNPSGKYRLKKTGLAKGIEIDCYSCTPKLPMFTR